MTASASSAISLPDFTDDAAAGLQSLRDRRSVMQKHPMPHRQQMAGHRAAHGAKANESDIDHVSFLTSLCSLAPLFAGRGLE
jgi:hypothetical protein